MARRPPPPREESTITTVRPDHAGAHDDEDVLAGFGYQDQLKRALGPVAIFGIAVSFMSITVSVYASYGVGLAALGPAFVFTWPVVLLGQLFVALIIAELGSRMPIAGYSYQWGARLVSTGYGWLIAIVAFAYLISSAATIAYEVVAPIVETMFGLPPTGSTTLALALATLAFTVVVNVVGVRLFARFNSVAVVAEVVAVLVLGLVALAIWAVDPHHPASILLHTGGLHGGRIWGGVAAALVMGLFSLTGFESAGDLSEEAVGAAGSIPRAVLFSLLGTGVLGFVALVCFTLALPSHGVGAVAASATPVADILTHRLGSTATRVLLIFPLLAALGTALSVVAVQGRLLFALARDNVAPGSATLRRVNGATRTPVVALVAGTVISSLLVVYANQDGHSFSTLIGSTAIFPYLVYLMLTFGYARRRRELAEATPHGRFSLGRWGTVVLVVSGVWLVAALCLLMIPTGYHDADLVVAAVLAVGLGWWATALRRRIVQRRAGVERISGPADAPRPAAPG